MCVCTQQPMFALVNWCFVTSGTFSCRGNSLFNLPCNGPARLGTLWPASTTERERGGGEVGGHPVACQHNRERERGEGGRE